MVASAYRATNSVSKFASERDFIEKLARFEILFAATDLLGSLSLRGGIVFTIYGLVMGFHVAAIGSASITGSGLSILIVTHIGKALLNIAETNLGILKELREGRSAKYQRRGAGRSRTRGR